MNLPRKSGLRLGVAVVSLCVSLAFGQAPANSSADAAQKSTPASDPAVAPVPPPPPPPNSYLDFVRAEAARYQAGRMFPKTAGEWEKQKTALHSALTTAWGGFPTKPAPLEPRVLGELRREGYRVEKIVFQTLPGVLMTANAYVPDKPGRHPAVLAVHGHWTGAKQDPVVQARCIGLVKQGFFVLAVDAFGAGERAVGKVLGEYHGDTTAATLLPVGLPLSGLQVYENLRAVDYLRTRPEVDPARIGITGASGGGNQTMYAGAWDARLSAVVPVCSVGNYPAYLGRACCMCEVVPGALAFADEWAVLGLAAPRGLLVINATQDSPVFSAEAAKVTMEPLQKLYALTGKPTQVRHATFESKHDYNQPMREAMYGWMTRHLKGEGDASPLPEPAHTTENPEDLRCYPGTTRPDDFITIPRFAAAEGRRLIAAWKTETNQRQAALLKVLGGLPPPVPGPKGEAAPGGARIVSFTSEPGIELKVYQEIGTRDSASFVVLVDFETIEQTSAGPLAAAVREAGLGLAIPELRATGRHAWPSDRVRNSSDHNTAQWGLWLGRPLLGQWAVDVRRAIDGLMLPRGQRVVLVGQGPAGVVALSVAALDQRIGGVATVGSLASYISEVPYQGQRMGLFAPGILRDVGDIAHVAALVAPRRVIIAGGVNGANQPLEAAALEANYAFTREVYSAAGAAGALVIQHDTSLPAVVERLAR